MNINFGQMMLQTARKFSDREALVNIERNRRYTFMELHLLTNQICNMMRDRFGLGVGDVYVNLVDNDSASLLNMWMIKGAVTGAWLNYRDSIQDHSWQLDRVNPKLAFVEAEKVDEYYSLLRDNGCEIISMDKVSDEREGIHYFWDLVNEASDAETGVEYEIDEHFPLYRFTGGTTGKGKCAMYTAGNLLSAMALFHADPDNMMHFGMRHVHITPLTHASSLFVLPIYFKGGTSISINLPDLAKMCDVIAKEKVTSTLLIPTLMYRFLETDYHTDFDLSSLETVMYGASTISPAKLVGLREKFGDVFVQIYGSTEAFPPITMLSKQDHNATTETEKAILRSAGTPLAGVELKIMDENGNELGQGETGEIWIRSRTIIKGYYKNPEQTAAEFQDGYWKSGDMGYIDEAGRIYIVDRKKDMIITGGFNVYAVEIEAAIDTHEAVLMSVVVGVPSEEWGEAIHAEVILKEGYEVETQELIDLVKERLGSYKAPKTITFVETLPTSAVGKLLRRKVRDPHWKGQERAI